MTMNPLSQTGVVAQVTDHNAKLDIVNFNQVLH